MDRFDDIWKNRFNDSNLPSGDWNSPDDDAVWDAILPHLPTRKDDKRRMLLWWWWGLGLLVITIFLFLLIRSQYVSGHQIPDSDHPAEIISMKVEESHTRSQVMEKDIVPAKSATDDQATPEVEVSNPTNRDQAKGAAVKYTDEVSLVEEQYREETETNTASLQHPLLESDQQSMAETDVPNQLSKVKSIQSIPTLSSVMLPSVEREDVVLDVKPPIKVLKNKPNRLGLAFNTGAVYWKHRISESYTSDLSAFDFNYTDNVGWQADFTLNYSINDYFSAFGGVQYESIRTHSGHNSELKYLVSIEQNASNDYDLNLATPYGLSRANFRFNRNQNVPSDEVDLTVDFSSDHQITNWSVPIGLAVYPLGRRSRIQPMASLAFGVNYLSGIKNSIGAIDTHHDAIQFDGEGMSSFEKPDLNQWHYDLRMRFGLSYQMTPGLQLQLQYGWTRGLSAIFQQSDYSTRIDRQQLSIGISKSIGR